MPFHSLIVDSEGWETLEGREVFANPYVQVQLLKVRTPTRPGGVEWTVVHRKAACVIVPVLEDGRFLLIRQERVPVRQAMWEFPAGQIDEGDATSPETVARNGIRELREETGYEPSPQAAVKSLGFFFSSQGFTDEMCHLLRVEPVVPSADGCRHDGDEAITGCRAVTLEELRAMIAGNEIRDANTLAAFARMSALGLLP